MADRLGLFPVSHPPLNKVHSADLGVIAATPSPLAVLPLLRTRSLGHNLYYYASTTSTNAVLKQLAARQVPAGTIVLAEEQSAGRGRMARGWFSPPHRGLYFSLLLHPQVDASRVTSLPLVIGASLIEVFAKKISGVNVQFKWPNDVLIDDKKVSGILCELHLGADGASNLIVGIGINVNTTLSDLPTELRGTATSLRMAGGQIVARPQLLADLLLTLENNIGLWQDVGFTPFMKALAQNDSLAGKTITVERTADTVTGVAEGLNLDGSLRLLLPNGTIESIYSGDAHIKK